MRMQDAHWDLFFLISKWLSDLSNKSRKKSRYKFFDDLPPTFRDIAFTPCFSKPPSSECPNLHRSILQATLLYQPASSHTSPSQHLWLLRRRKAISNFEAQKKDNENQKIYNWALISLGICLQKIAIEYCTQYIPVQSSAVSPSGPNTTPLRCDLGC